MILTKSVNNNNLSPKAATCKQLSIARLPLSLQLPLARVSQLRKTISAIAGEGDNLLHNHVAPTQVIYRYPLVQYKSIGGKAAVMGIGEAGCQSLERLVSISEFAVIFSENNLVHLEKETLELSLSDRLYAAYHLTNWLPFNNENCRKFEQAGGLIARTALMESCLTGHILKLCSSICWLLPPRSLIVEINTIHSLGTQQVFGNRFNHAFNLRFRTNITLPEGIGLGKAVSHGFGVVSKIN